MERFDYFQDLYLVYIRMQLLTTLSVIKLKNKVQCFSLKLFRSFFLKRVAFKVQSTQIRFQIFAI